MGLFSWLDSKIKNMRWYDISLVKLSTAAFILMIAKLWPPLLSLAWHWYLIIALLAAIIPLKNLFKEEAVV
ncbi:unnamed protein product [marine sediment metagenome]|uniref:ComEC/Rec2-related protein domain-containing protein n=1 Tax=marine sediment metagenome TaxID=412755 RepID=X1W0D0_9ZZZZ